MTKPHPNYFSGLPALRNPPFSASLRHSAKLRRTHFLIKLLFYPDRLSAEGEYISPGDWPKVSCRIPYNVAIVVTLCLSLLISQISPPAKNLSRFSSELSEMQNHMTGRSVLPIFRIVIPYAHLLMGFRDYCGTSRMGAARCSSFRIYMPDILPTVEKCSSTFSHRLSLPIGIPFYISESSELSISV